MSSRDTESAVLLLPCARVWDLLLRVNLDDVFTCDAHRPRAAPLDPTPAPAGAVQDGAFVSAASLQVPYILELSYARGGAVVRRETFRLRPVTVQAATLLEWTTTESCEGGAAACGGGGDDGVATEHVAAAGAADAAAIAARRRLPKRQLFHFLRDEANPKPADQKLEDLLGCLLGQIKSTPSYLDKLAAVEVETLPGWTETVARGDGVLTVDMDALGDFQLPPDDGGAAREQTNPDVDLSKIDLSGAEAALLAQLNISFS